MFFLFCFKVNKILSEIPTLQSWTGDDETEAKLKVSITTLSMNILKEELKQNIKILYKDILHWSEYYSMLTLLNLLINFYL